MRRTLKVWEKCREGEIAAFDGCEVVTGVGQFSLGEVVGLSKQALLYGADATPGRVLSDVCRSGCGLTARRSSQTMALLVGTMGAPWSQRPASVMMSVLAGEPPAVAFCYAVQRRPRKRPTMCLLIDYLRHLISNVP